MYFFLILLQKISFLDSPVQFSIARFNEHLRALGYVDAAAMHTAGQILVGLHDFTTFRDVQCQAKSPVKTLDSVRVWREGEEVRLEFSARSFLHRQVRSMTGTLAEVGAGRWTAAEVQTALDAKDRKACGPVAPAGGLYLVEAIYPTASK